MYQIQKHDCSSSRPTAVFAQSIEARCLTANEAVVVAAPTSDAPINL